jgi:GNAT superfamily N-acetyltransferase
MSGSAENLEYRALVAWFDAAQTHASANWAMHEIGDATCFVSPEEPSILVNRVLGLGSQSAPTIDQLIAIRELYANAGVKRFFLHVLSDSPGMAEDELLAEAGYRKYRGWMKFERGDGPIRNATTDLTVREIDRSSAADFASIVGSAFDFERSFQPAIASLVDAPGWRLFMSFEDGAPAGTGALFVNEGLGYLDFGATDPAFRRRGSQTALLGARIRTALDAGCHTIVTMTGEAVPGDAQHSYRNIEKAGFKASYLRENWIPSDS